MSTIDSGLSAWKMRSNHNHMINLQFGSGIAREEGVEVAYFGGSAFRITSPMGVSIMIDPWRNHPAGGWDWFFNDFPLTAVDIGISTHAHYDHDALHRLDANVLLDRLIGTYAFSDVTIYGIADKHSSDNCCSLYDYKMVMKELHGVDILPPDNPRSWDNCLIVIETGGLRILHWGDNRSNPPEEVWQQLGKIDIAFLPVEDSEHVMGFDGVTSIINRLQPQVVIPHHYYIWDMTLRQSTLLKADKWLSRQQNVTHLQDARTVYKTSDIGNSGTQIHFFGDNVLFDKKKWRNGDLP